MKIIGVYKIESLIKPKRCYIGSSIDINKRWLSHLGDLRRNKHGNMPKMRVAQRSLRV